MPRRPPRLRHLFTALFLFSAIVGIATSVWLLLEAREALRGAEWREGVNRVANGLLATARSAAVERGMTTVALALPGGADAALREELLRHRARAEQALAVVMADVAALGERVADGVVVQRMAAVRARHERLRQARAEVDRALADGAGGRPGSWFALATAFNESLGELQDTLCAVGVARPGGAEGCPLGREDIFWISELAARERGLMAGAIAAGRPISRAEIARLESYQAILEHRLEQLTERLTTLPDGTVSDALLADLQAEFYGHYRALRGEVLRAGAAGGPYPFDAMTWYGRASEGLEPLFALARPITRVTEQWVRELRRQTRFNVVMQVTLVALLLASFGVAVGVAFRRVLRRLDTLGQAARAIQAGDLERPVCIAGGDELAELGAVFEGMRRSLLADRERRQEQQQRLSRANEELEQFAYVASHDLKAPLRAVDNLAAWLEEDLGALLSDDQRRQMQLLRGRVGHMRDLIDGLLAYARAGRGESRVEEVAVAEVIAAVVAARPLPSGFDLRVEGELPHLLTARVSLQQVFANLIGNAVEHHDRTEGCIRIAARNAGDCYELSVADDGPGIPPERRQAVFEMFRSYSRQGGTGIGLALVKKLVEQAGGRIDLEGGEGRGTTFRFTWPKRPAAPN